MGSPHNNVMSCHVMPSESEDINATTSTMEGPGLDLAGGINNLIFGQFSMGFLFFGEG